MKSRDCNFRSKKVKPEAEFQECNLPFGENYCTNENYRKCKVRGYAIEGMYQGGKK